jgi:hypothetical protein
VTTAVTLRPARAGDAEAVCLIYNQGIEDRVATLETEPRTPEERREWMAARGPRQPVWAPSRDAETRRAGNQKPVLSHGLPSPRVFPPGLPCQTPGIARFTGAKASVSTAIAL